MDFYSYGRKSIFSDHSDSVDNQFRMCREWVNFHFPGEVDSFLEYSDEGFTGANTDRPDLQRMLADIKANSRIGCSQALVVYQLDRLSRDIRDFSNIYATLAEHDVKFISIKENIDTATPIGRAMMYIIMIFAQMERETIAARVSDNMIGLAKKGYWTGGKAPKGYVREPMVVNGKKHVKLALDPEGVEYMMWLADTFLNNKYSLKGMQNAFRKQGILTQGGCFFSTTQLYDLLTSPFGVEATPEVYDFFAAKGCQMDEDSPREKWDGSTGVLVYGRTTEINHKRQRQPPEKWKVYLGLQKPYISASKWLAIQNQFGKNKIDKKMKYDIPLLKGVLRCSCGSLMSVSRKKRKKGVSSWYYCERRMQRGPEACDREQIKIEKLDEKVLDIFRAIQKDRSVIYDFVKEDTQISSAPDTKQTASRVAACEAKIERLTASLALAEKSTAAKYIIAEMERLDLELQALKREHNFALSASRIHEAGVKTADAKAVEISKLIEGLDGFTAAERNEIVREVVKECTWDGKSLTLIL